MSCQSTSRVVGSLQTPSRACWLSRKIVRRLLLNSSRELSACGFFTTLSRNRQSLRKNRAAERHQPSSELIIIGSLTIRLSLERNLGHPVLEAILLSAPARPRNHACTKNRGCLFFSCFERTCSGSISRLPWRCSLARRSDLNGRSGWFLLSQLMGSLANCVP